MKNACSSYLGYFHFSSSCCALRSSFCRSTVSVLSLMKVDFCVYELTRVQFAIYLIISVSRDKGSTCYSKGNFLQRQCFSQLISFIPHCCLCIECLRTAVTFQQNMNLDVNPCDDFYEYVCGNFDREHPKGDAQFSHDW